MNIKTKRIIKDVASAGAWGVYGIVATALKVLGTILLILMLTGVIFASIFVIYLKTHLTSNLDVTLEEVSVNQTSVIYYEDPDTGEYKEYTKLIGSEKRKWLDYKEIPKEFEHAVVAIEDKRFYDHHGVDWSRTASAFVHMFINNSNTFGGSTLTQQLIKNVTEEDDVTVQRKLSEIFKALEMEKNYEKDEIITWYLNYVYFGHGCYGIAAATDHYFGKDVDEVSVAEIACIVGITNNPSMFSPYVNVERNKERQETILYEMMDQGYITEQEYNAAVKEKLHFVDHTKKTTTETGGTVYSWFTEAIIDDALADIMEARGCNKEIASGLLYNGGYQIYATINPKIQAIVDEIYADSANFTNGDYEPLQSAIVITDPYEGKIVAMSGGVGEKTGNLWRSRATDARRPAGSSTKPLSAYAPAMEYGLITPNTKIEDSEDVTLPGVDWMPKNDDRKYDGIVTIRQALMSSINTVAAQLVYNLTPEVSYKFMLEKLHFTSLEPDDCSFAPLALGQYTYGVTVREMAAAYSIFPNGGVYNEARTYTKILDADGKLVLDNDPVTNVAISEATAYWMTSMLHDAATSGTGYESRIDGMPTAGKTGTTSDNFDRWFCGFTPYYVGAVWTGYDYPAKIKWKGNPATQIWQDVMEAVHADLEYKDFPIPADTFLKPVPGVEEVICTIRGVTYDFFGYETELYSEEKTSVDTRELTITAQEIEGYVLVGPSEITYTVDGRIENIIEFVYEPETPLYDPTLPWDPNDPNYPYDPNNPYYPENPYDPSIPTDPTAPTDPDTGNGGLLGALGGLFGA